MKKDPKTSKPYPLRVISQTLRLPQYTSHFENYFKLIDAKLAEQESTIKKLSNDIDQKNEIINRLKNRLDSFDALDNKISDIKHQLSKNVSKTISSDSKVTINNTVSDNDNFDNFYKLFEDRFRGSEKEIQDRVSEHLPLFQSMADSLKKLPIVDIGCGRGEFLSVMKKNKFKAVGVDMNGEMVDRANSLGLKAVKNDAASYLQKQKSGSISAITGFHIIEHIPFESLMEIFEECYRVTARGGFVLFETPNPSCLYVGANTFYFDPSHQRPVPSELLAFMLEYVGFAATIVPLHRLEKELETDNTHLKKLHSTIFGYADYAVIARKD